MHNERSIILLLSLGAAYTIAFHLLDLVRLIADETPLLGAYYIHAPKKIGTFRIMPTMLCIYNRQNFRSFPFLCFHGCPSVCNKQAMVRQEHRSFESGHSEAEMQCRLCGAKGPFVCVEDKRLKWDISPCTYAQNAIKFTCRCAHGCST